MTKQQLLCPPKRDGSNCERDMWSKSELRSVAELFEIVFTFLFACYFCSVEFIVLGNRNQT